MISGQLNSVTLRRLLAIAVIWGGIAQHSAIAQIGLIRGGVVGGVSVDAEGAVRQGSIEERQGWLRQLRDSVADPGAGLSDATQLRMVSLAKLQQEVARAIAAGEPLSQDVVYMAGLQRVEYVFVYPDRNDIVLAGPAEGWTVRQDATVVGRTSGRPVLHLEDLVTALRTVDAAQQSPISVSIEPTPEGSQRLNRLLGQVRVTDPSFNPARLEPAMRDAFGPQLIKLTTVADDSRMAHTLVAADYHMKRLAMYLDKSPVEGLPSYMEMIRNSNLARDRHPRWWMACDYDAILHSPDMLAWKLTGSGIKAMTEDEFVDRFGVRTGTGQVNKVAQRWADLFTEKFDELCAINAAFGDLRNVMDLNIVATVIRGHDLEGVAGCDFGLLRGDVSGLDLPTRATPKTLAAECSFIRGSAWVVSASGGVEINPWRVVSEQSRDDAQVKQVYTRAMAASKPDQWWW